jgi:hypothetical protein
LQVSPELVNAVADKVLDATRYVPPLVGWLTGRKYPTGDIPPEVGGPARAVLVWLGPRLSLEKAGPLVAWCEEHPVSVIGATLIVVGVSRIMTGLAAEEEQKAREKAARARAA